MCTLSQGVTLLPTALCSSLSCFPGKNICNLRWVLPSRLNTNHKSSETVSSHVFISTSIVTWLFTCQFSGFSLLVVSHPSIALDPRLLGGELDLVTWMVAVGGLIHCSYGIMFVCFLLFIQAYCIAFDVGFGILTLYDVFRWNLVLTVLANLSSQLVDSGGSSLS